MCAQLCRCPYTVPVLVVVPGSTDITAQRSGGYGTPCTHATHFVPSPMKPNLFLPIGPWGGQDSPGFPAVACQSTVLSVALEPGGRGIPKDGRKSARGGFLSLFIWRFAPCELERREGWWR